LSEESQQSTVELASSFSDSPEARYWRLVQSLNAALETPTLDWVRR
jgi:hypothetical protein